VISSSLCFKRSGGQEQYSEALAIQTRLTDRVADIAAWIMANLQAGLVGWCLAAGQLRPRHFSRRFQRASALAPAAFVEKLRMDEARASPERRATAPFDRVEISGSASAATTCSADFARRFWHQPQRLSQSVSAYRPSLRAPLEIMIKQQSPRGRPPPAFAFHSNWSTNMSLHAILRAVRCRRLLAHT